MATILRSFFFGGFGGGTNFLLSGRCVGQGSFASCKRGDAHCYLIFSLCTFSFVQFSFFFGTHVITQTQDIRTGVLAGNDAKETKVQKYKRLPKKKESLQKGCLKISQAGGEKNREPEVVACQNDTQKCYLKSQLLIKMSSGGIQHSYREESCVLTN